MKKYGFRFLIVFIPLVVEAEGISYPFGNPFETELGKVNQDKISYFIASSEELPSPCRLATEFKTTPIFPATTNPNITDDKKLINFVSKIGFGSQNNENVVAALSALYYSQTQSNEVGIWGLLFKNEVSTTKFIEGLKYRDVLQKENLLISLWEDDESGESCKNRLKSILVTRGFSVIDKK